MRIIISQCLKKGLSSIECKLFSKLTSCYSQDYRLVAGKQFQFPRLLTSKALQGFMTKENMSTARKTFLVFLKTLYLSFLSLFRIKQQTVNVRLQNKIKREINTLTFQVIYWLSKKKMSWLKGNIKGETLKKSLSTITRYHKPESSFISTLIQKHTQNTQ